jgi:hypothetical protein
LKALQARVTKSAGSRRNPREHAELRKEKGQPRVVGLLREIVQAAVEYLLDFDDAVDAVQDEAGEFGPSNHQLDERRCYAR